MSPLDAIAAEIVAARQLSHGARVLDACCGSGVSALRAAEAVGPFGCVLALGCDDEATALSRAEAARLGIGNVSFRPGGLEMVDEQPESFDAVVCAFANTMPAEVLIRQLWQWVRVDGQLIVAVIEGAIEPGHSIFVEAFQEVKRGAAVSAWGDSFRSAPGLARLLAITGGETKPVDVLEREMRLNSADQWWSQIVTREYRAALAGLAPAELQRVRETVLNRLASQSWQSTTMRVACGSAVKRQSSAPVI